MKRMLQKFSRGSILAYSLILLGIVLVASIGMMSASITNLRSVSSNEKSTNAFQIADSGSQAVVAKIKKDSSGNISSLGDCSNGGGGEAVVTQSDFLGGEYKVSFSNDDDATHPKLNCNDPISLVTSIKSVGTYADTARAVEVAIAAGGCDSSNNGGVVIVDEKNDSGHPDWDAIDDFMNDHGPIVGYKCDIPAGGGGGSIVVESLFGGVSDFRLSTLTFAYSVPSTSFAVGVSGSFQCTQGGGCVHYTGSSLPCSNGWRIYGMCSK